jgi:hypothetical protein
MTLVLMIEIACIPKLLLFVTEELVLTQNAVQRLQIMLPTETMLIVNQSVWTNVISRTVFVTLNHVRKIWIAKMPQAITKLVMNRLLLMMVLRPLLYALMPLVPRIKIVSIIMQDLQSAIPDKDFALAVKPTRTANLISTLIVWLRTVHVGITHVRLMTIVHGNIILLAELLPKIVSKSHVRLMKIVQSTHSISL